MSHFKAKMHLIRFLLGLPSIQPRLHCHCNTLYDLPLHQGRTQGLAGVSERPPHSRSRSR